METGGDKGKGKGDGDSAHKRKINGLTAQELLVGRKALQS
jgi:hypothetical protein